VSSAPKPPVGSIGWRDPVVTSLETSLAEVRPQRAM